MFYWVMGAAIANLLNYRYQNWPKNYTEATKRLINGAEKLHEDFHMMPLVLWLLWPMSTGAISMPNRHGYYYKKLCEQIAEGSAAHTGICHYYFPQGQKATVHGTSFHHLRTEGTAINSAQNALSSSPILLVYQSQLRGKSSILSQLLISL